jgi:hypothetical protein
MIGKQYSEALGDCSLSGSKCASFIDAQSFHSPNLVVPGIIVSLNIANGCATSIVLSLSGRVLVILLTRRAEVVTN